ncbi:MAG: hypothetical protein FRX48_04794 [Lasallia pustulata]|uniref:Ysc84 actin-binding domain-containing protein n=1 Tax=Lasallia pustulata TaxID=136370 RepID=A0A5M8PPU5_9LECA|nr:MAG: hypothetical protein FRX48_04794 [Lasallia pustulata]
MPIPALPAVNWSKTKTSSKAGFDKVWTWADKLGAPVNRLSNKLGAEAFWPTTLDKESDKAARILRSFCKDGFYTDVDPRDPGAQDGPKAKQKVVKKIPTQVIKKAKGLAIFTTMRTGLWVSGAGGSGVLVARTASGEWSPPSGILLHTAGLGFLVGVDIYDCVIVINSEKALEAFTKIRCTLGGEVSAVAGPVGVGGILETEIHKRQAPLWTYLKSRGFYAGVQVDGTVVIERTDENERFYGQRIGVADILAGKARHPPYETRRLLATIKAAQGDTDVDQSALLDSEPTPGDMLVERMDDGNGFGLPAPDDPDPFGVRALEEAGLEIREAGTRSRPSSEAFEYKPAPTSPIFNVFNRRSISTESTTKSESRRDSKMSVASVDRGTQTGDMGTQTIPEGELHNPGDQSPVKKTSQNLTEEPDEDDLGLERFHSESGTQGSEIHEIHASESPVVSRARLVTIPKRIPPPLPPRSPYRTSVPTTTHADPLPEANENKEDQRPQERSTGTQALSADPDGFDDVSISASESPRRDTIALHDHDAAENDATAAWKEVGENMDHGSEEQKEQSQAEEQKEQSQAEEQKDQAKGEGQDEFHSMPNTPLDARPPVAFPIRIDTFREDFS